MISCAMKTVFVPCGHVEPDRARRMRRDGRDNVSSPSAVQAAQIAAGDSTCPAGFRGCAVRYPPLSNLLLGLNMITTIIFPHFMLISF